MILSCSPPSSSCFYLCVYDLTMASASAYSKDPSLLASTCHFEILYDYTCLILKIVLEVAFVVTISLLGRSWWRLRHIPGPFTAAVGFPQFCKFRDNHYSEVELEKLYYKYGDVVRTGPSRIVTTDLQALERLTPIISAHESGFFRRVSQNVTISYFSPPKSPDDEEHVRKSLDNHTAMDVAKVAVCVEDHCYCFLGSTSIAQELVDHVAAAFEAPYTHEVQHNRYADGSNTQPALLNEMYGHFLLGTVNCMAATIQNTLTRINASPVVYAKLRNEIDGSQDERGDLSYLQAVVREGLRLFPIRTIALYTVPEDGETVGGYDIAPGTTVALNNKALLHSKSIWGADADIFRPERWLEATPTVFATMHKVLIAPWGIGETATLHQKVYQTAISGIILQSDLHIRLAARPHSQAWEKGNFQQDQE
ncbi:hypothetical protein G7054_g6397 [Neopestalotiopsis clavispora]|nr:hypothetical protein G7054_g6397 [Neopestalotiopsis clavispora]